MTRKLIFLLFTLHLIGYGQTTVDAGANISVCEGDLSVTINNVQASNFSSMAWSTSGTGNFTNMFSR